jgi:hypothetical protein
MAMDELMRKFLIESREGLDRMNGDIFRLLAGAHATSNRERRASGPPGPPRSTRALGPKSAAPESYQCQKSGTQQIETSRFRDDR